MYPNLNTTGDGSARRGGTMGVDSPKAQISGGKATCHSQRVEDNAFHSGLLGNIRWLFTAWFNGGDFGEIGREIVCGERLDIHFD